MRWAGHVARMGESRGAYRVLVGKREGIRPFGRPRHRWGDNDKMGPQTVGWGRMDWIDMARDRERWWALVNVVMNIRFPYNVGISWLAENWLTFQEGLCSMELVTHNCGTVVTCKIYFFLSIFQCTSRSPWLRDEFHWDTFDHPPYSPDLAPSDFHLFLKMKEHLAGKRHADDDEDL